MRGERRVMKRQMNKYLLLAILAGAALAPISAAAETRTWSRASNVTGDWCTATNWLPADSPQAGDTVIVTNGYVLLTNATGWLDSFTITNATLIFLSTNALLSATNVTIRNNGKLTHFTNSATATNESGEWIPDARVQIACSNLTVMTGGSINAGKCGYAGGSSASVNGRGAGGGIADSYNPSGGGHGGQGGQGLGVHVCQGPVIRAHLQRQGEGAGDVNSHHVQAFAVQLASGLVRGQPV